MILVLGGGHYPLYCTERVFSHVGSYLRTEFVHMLQFAVWQFLHCKHTSDQIFRATVKMCEAKVVGCNDPFVSLDDDDEDLDSKELQ